MFGNTYTEMINSKVKELLQIRKINDGWNFEKKRNFLNHFTRKYMNNQINLNKIEGIFPTYYQKTVDYFTEGILNKQRQQQCGQQEILEKIDENTFVTIDRLRGNLIFSPREFLCVQHKYVINENETLIIRSDIDCHHFINSNVNTIRGSSIVYGIFLKQLNDKQTNFEAYMLFDLRGNISPFIQNSMGGHNINIFEDDISSIQKNCLYNNPYIINEKN